MPKKILIIDGHPDALAERYLHALAKAYCEGARSRGHEVRSILVSELGFPLLRISEDFRTGIPTETIRGCQGALAWADHVVILFPLWLGSMPALLKGFLEQLLRPGFAFAAASGLRLPKKLLAGKVGMVDSMGAARRGNWLARVQKLGKRPGCSDARDPHPGLADPPSRESHADPT